jgi:hypothetical protein
MISIVCKLPYVLLLFRLPMILAAKLSHCCQRKVVPLPGPKKHRVSILFEVPRHCQSKSAVLHEVAASSHIFPAQHRKIK